MKATPQQRKEMQRTQPKKVRHIDMAAGTDRMVTVEPSEVEKERLAAHEVETGE
jgi:hypothetical protein